MAKQIKSRILYIMTNKVNEEKEVIALLDRKEVKVRRLLDEINKEMVGIRYAYEALTKQYGSVVKRCEKLEKTKK